MWKSRPSSALWRPLRQPTKPVSSEGVATRIFFLFSTVLACATLLFIGCKSLPPSKPASEWTPQEARGAAVFERYCARCHYPTTTHGLKGPGLQAITKVKAMPSGMPPTDERLSATILHGRGMMPATPLDDGPLQDLLAYLHTL
jgi:mono/diheme cytochrome c family protein